jgi:CRISPR/Cas system-associated exonuclease Cas4 (RecB family)
MRLRAARCSSSEAAPFSFYKENIMATLSELRATPHTSISRTKLYLSCPRKFHYTYQQREVLPSFRPLALLFGSAWHATIGEHLLRSRHDDQVHVDELRAHLRDGIVRGFARDDVPVLFEEEEQTVGAVVDVAVRMLDAFLATVALPDKVYGVEVPFSIELVHPTTGEIHPLPLIGAMDAVVEIEGHPVVLELKTSKRRYSVDVLELDLQPTAYGVAARVLGYGDVGLQLVVTLKGKKPDVQVEHLVRHRRDESELVEVVIGVHRAIDAGADHPIRSWQCRTCPYAHACGS